ncbi:MAG TPA: hypothetical protein VFX76_14440, partial [Roseiflexaceae bacterium]|nr:hypothetical protein [Roseiflexaceae bacterium]
MTNSPLSLTHLVRPATQGQGTPPLLLMFHGIGSNEEDLMGLESYLDERFTIVSARAPHPYGYGGYAWFEIDWQPTGIRIDRRQAAASRDLIVMFVGEAVAAYGADPAQVYLLGFSQGAMMSGWVTLTEPELVAGAVLMSGRIPDEVRPQIVAPERLEGKPILVTHGLMDQVLPIANGRGSRDLLQQLPVDLTYREYPMAHEVNMQSLTDVVQWLSARLDKDRR